MVNSKERGIVFSAPMVHALLKGQKTVTRRVCKPAQAAALSWVVDRGAGLFGDEEGSLQFACPYGKPGDRLWVRETHFINPYLDAHVPEEARARCEVVYRADSLPCAEGKTQERRWRPSIFMPRWASRILLEIIDVHVERLQDISEEQSAAEGVDFLRSAPDVDGTLTARQLYEVLWNHINGRGAWDANPWIWAVSFKRVTPEAFATKAPPAATATG